MFGGLLFPAITSLLTLLVFYIEKMIENIIITGFDGILKTLPSLIIFGLVFKLLISVVSKGLVYFLLWKYKAELIQFILGSKARWLRMILETKLKRGHKDQRGSFTSTIEKSFICSTPWELCLSRCWFRSWKVMNAKSHFQNVGSFFTNKESEHQPR